MTEQYDELASARLDRVAADLNRVLNELASGVDVTATLDRMIEQVRAAQVGPTPVLDPTVLARLNAALTDAVSFLRAATGGEDGWV